MDRDLSRRRLTQGEPSSPAVSGRVVAGAPAPHDFGERRLLTHLAAELRAKGDVDAVGERGRPHSCDGRQVLVVRHDLAPNSRDAPATPRAQLFRAHGIVAGDARTGVGRVGGLKRKGWVASTSFDFVHCYPLHTRIE